MSQHVARIEIGHFPDQATTRIALTPADLDRVATTRATITDATEVARIAALVQRMPAVEDGSAHPDSRWSVVLCDRSGKPLRTVYLDRSGRRAVIDGKPAHVLATPVVRALARALRELPRCDSR